MWFGVLESKYCKEVKCSLETVARNRKNWPEKVTILTRDQKPVKGRGMKMIVQKEAQTMMQISQSTNNPVRNSKAKITH